MNAGSYIAALKAAFETNADTSLVPAMSKYLRGKFQFFGLKSDPRREVSSAHIHHYGIPGSTEWKPVVEGCWTEECREMQYFGMELTFRCRKYWEKEDIRFIEWLIVHKSWWDSVDYIASTICGTYFRKFPEQTDTIIMEWKRSENIWLVRSAILFQLKYKTETNFTLLKNVIEDHRNSSEFFIQKAIGWALRQYGKFAPEVVIHYVENTELKALSRKEALKHLA